MGDGTYGSFVYSNMKRSSSTFDRILALDLHPRSFGYAVFENADLLDWGLRKWPSRQLRENLPAVRPVATDAAPYPGRRPSAGV